MVLDRLRNAAHMLQGARVVLRHRPGSVYTVADRLEERADEHPDRPFLFYEDRQLSWGEVDAGANRVAHWAHARGLGQGDVVALMMENRPEFLITWMGLAKLGVVTALINTNLSGGALDHALRTAGTAHLVLGSELLDVWETVSQEVRDELELWVQPDGEADAPARPDAHDLRAILRDQPIARPDPRLRDDLRARDLLFYIYTSGTTGNPKAARFSHVRFFGAGDSFAWACEMGPDDVEYLALPLYHSAGGVVAVGRAMAAGCRLVIKRRFSASAFWDDIRRYEATCFQYIGEFCRYLMAQPERPEDPEHGIRVVAGNGLRPDVWEAFQKRFAIPKIIEFYGATEGNTVMVNLGGKVGAVGYYPRFLDFANNAKIVRFDVESETHPRGEDGFCIECDAGEPGEMLGRISTSSRVAAGHFEGYTSKEASDRKVLRDVFAKGDAWFRTGDLLTRDADGYYYFVDRIGDTFRWKGENVSTQEVAEALAGFPGLDLINIYGVQVPESDGRAGMMAFVPVKGADFDPQAFYAFVADKLPRYAAPVFVRVLPEAEVTGTFKLRKVELQKDGFDPGRVADALYVRDDEKGRYEPLTADRFADIQAGRLRL